MRHAAAEQKQLRVRRRQRQGEFVIQPAIRITEHLVFIHHQQGRAIAADQTVLLRLQRRHENRRVEILRKVAGGDAHIPTAARAIPRVCRWPTRGWERCKWPGRDFCRIRPEFENQGFARPGGRVHDHILALAQARDGLLLPEVGNGDLVEGGVGGQLFGER